MTPKEVLGNLLWAVGKWALEALLEDLLGSGEEG